MPVPTVTYFFRKATFTLYSPKPHLLIVTLPIGVIFFQATTDAIWDFKPSLYMSDENGKRIKAFKKNKQRDPVVCSCTVSVTASVSV